MNYLKEMRQKFSSNINKGKILNFNELIKEPINEEEHEFIPFLKSWYDSIVNCSFLPKLTSDMEEVYIFDANNFVIKEADKKRPFESVINQKDLDIFFELIALKKGVDWNYNEPFTSFDYVFQCRPTRVTMIHHSSSQDGKSKMFIRLLNNKTIPIENYQIDPLFFSEVIKKKKNIMIAGSTGSGKTTFTNSLLSMIKHQEHILLIEDTPELISPNNRTTKLITDKKNPKKSMNSYLEYALRMSPDRIILGEIRSKEIETSLLAMNTGHNGFLSTIHANSAEDAIHRMALLFKIYSQKELEYSLIIKLITTNIDYVVFLDNKKVVDIIEVFGSNSENIFFETVHKKAPRIGA